jgi:hypothetical protein
MLRQLSTWRNPRAEENDTQNQSDRENHRTKGLALEEMDFCDRFDCSNVSFSKVRPSTELACRMECCMTPKMRDTDKLLNSQSCS